MKNDEFTQLTLWSEEDLPPVIEVPPTDGAISEIDQESNKQEGEGASYTQLTLEGLWA